MTLALNILFIAFGIFAFGVLGYLAYVLINGALNDGSASSKPVRTKPRPKATSPSSVSKRGLVPVRFTR